MASNAKCIFFLLLVLFFSLQETHARDSKFFSKVSKNTKQHHASITLSPTQAPTLSSPTPSPEPEVIEHGYGLYGQDLYQNYEYQPTKTNPPKGGEKNSISGEEMSKNNFNEFGNNGKQGMSDTRFLENGKYYYDPNQGVRHGNGNGNGMKRQGLSDTRFLENGKYYYDPNQDVGHQSSYFPKGGNGNGNGNGIERQGMSDTRFLENGKYYHDINNEEEKNNGHFNSNHYDNFENFAEDEEEKISHFNTNNNFENLAEDDDENFEDEKDGNQNYDFDDHYDNGRMASKEQGNNARFEMGNNNGAEKHGMSDTRFLENGKYFYDLENDKYSDNHVFNNIHNFNNNINNNKFGAEDVGFHSNNNVEYAKSYHENENNDSERGGYNNYQRNEHGYNGVRPKKFPNEYDTMEEYDREQGNFDGQDKYVP